MRLFISLSADGEPTSSEVPDLEAIGFDVASRAGVNPNSIVEIEPGVSLMVFDSEDSSPSRLQTALMEQRFVKYAIKLERYREDYLGLGAQAVYYKLTHVSKN